MDEFALVAAGRADHAVATLCRVVGASVGGFHARLRAIPPTRARADAAAGLRGLIGRPFAVRRRACGSRRVHAEPRREGRRPSRRRVERLVRAMGPQARRGRRRPPRTTGSRHDPPVAPNLLDRHLVAERPDTVRLADIGHLPTGEGWLHPAATGDPATREVVGRGMADHLRAGLCVDALATALQRRRPGPGPVRHGDRGVQYAAGPHRRALERRGIERSMGREGDCPDDAPTESFLASPEKENVHHVHFRTRAEARAAVLEDVEIPHDRQRPHPASGCRTPAEARAGTEGTGMRAAA